MKKNQAIKCVVASAIMLMLVFTNKANGATVKVTTETLNLRSEASTSSTIVMQLNLGEELQVISEEDNWYKVKVDGKEGYVSKDYVELTEEESTETPVTTTPSNNEEETPSNNGNVTTSVNTGDRVTLQASTDIRILPLINSNILGIANAEETLTVITSTNKWLYVQTDEISGWIAKSYIDGTATNKDEEQNPENTNNDDVQSNDDDEKTEPEENNSNTNQGNSGDELYSSSVTMYVSESSVYVRSLPSTSGDIVTTLIKNTDVTVVGENNGWYKVKYNELSGYIRKDLLSDSKIETTNRSGTTIDRTETETLAEENITTVSTNSLGTQIVEYAKQYLGCPYVYGGSGSTSFDCSGFTMYVYNHFGYSLSHSATAQSKVGTYVAKENLQPGDLVFFLDYETMDGIGHCGIYIGDGNFIHASSGSGYCVKISTLLSGSYLNRYATARRLV